MKLTKCKLDQTLGTNSTFGLLFFVFSVFSHFFGHLWIRSNLPARIILQTSNNLQIINKTMKNISSLEYCHALQWYHCLLHWLKLKITLFTQQDKILTWNKTKSYWWRSTTVDMKFSFCPQIQNNKIRLMHILTV